jgi:hypothetical protein
MKKETVSNHLFFVMQIEHENRLFDFAFSLLVPKRLGGGDVY